MGAASCRRGVDLEDEGGIGVLQLLLGDGAPEALVLVVALFVFKLDIDIVVFDRVLPVPGFAVGVGGVDKALVVENKPHACQRFSVLVDGAELNLLLDLFDAVLGELLVPEQLAKLGIFAWFDLEEKFVVYLFSVDRIDSSKDKRLG